MKTGIIDWNDPKFNDPMEEIYAIRRLISEKNDHDIHKLFESVRQKDARAKALGMTYGEYCLAEVEGRLPLCACEEPAEYKAGAPSDSLDAVTPPHTPGLSRSVP